MSSAASTGIIPRKTTTQIMRASVDATRFCTERESWCRFFGAIDHYSDDIVGWHTAKLGDRWAALEPMRQGVRHAFGRFGRGVVRGLRIRCDWGPQYIADAWINEVYRCAALRGGAS